MTTHVLTGATNHFNFKSLPNGRIILSEEAYLRLNGCINLCAFSGQEELEYGTFLYGKEIQPNVIYFDVPSKYDDYIPSKREFDVNRTMMHNELINNVENSTYDCIAHIHTHPYIGGTCRFFSNQDLNMIKKLQADYQPKTSNKRVYFFGGLLTISSSNKPEEDEISFVYYDANVGSWFKITDISIFMDNKEEKFSVINERTRMNFGTSPSQV